MVNLATSHIAGRPPQALPNGEPGDSAWISRSNTRERPRRFGIDRRSAFGIRDGLPRPYTGSVNPCRGAECKLLRSEQMPSKSNGSVFAAPSTPRSPGRTNLKRPFLVEDGEKAVDSPAKKIVAPGAGGAGTKGVLAVPKSPTKIPQAIRTPVKSPTKAPSRKAGGPMRRLPAIAPGGSATARRASLRHASLVTPKQPLPAAELAPFSTPAPLAFPLPARWRSSERIPLPRNKPRPGVDHEANGKVRNRDALRPIHRNMQFER